MRTCYCGAAMSGPKYFDDGFRYYHIYRCPVGHEEHELRPHAEWEVNQRAMRSLDARDCAAINAQATALDSEAPADFNYGRGR